MSGGALFDFSPAIKPRRWPLAAGFGVVMVIVCLVVMLPLLTASMISVPSPPAPRGPEIYKGPSHVNSAIDPHSVPVKRLMPLPKMVAVPVKL